MKNLFRHLVTKTTLTLGASLLAINGYAAQGEMGLGVPTFGSYSSPTGSISTIVWSLANTAVPFPTGCTYLILSTSTMGMDAYKIALATLLVAKATNKSVRFYAHTHKDNGCGVDYVQLHD